MLESLKVFNPEIKGNVEDVDCSLDNTSIADYVWLPFRFDGEMACRLLRVLPQWRGGLGTSLPAPPAPLHLRQESGWADRPAGPTGRQTARPGCRNATGQYRQGRESEMWRCVGVVGVLMLIMGCQTTHEDLIAKGYPPAFADGRRRPQQWPTGRRGDHR